MLKLSFKKRFLLLVSLLAIGCLEGYSQNDFDKPVLSNYTVSPSSVDISSGTQTLTLNITASDASGVVTPTSVVLTLYFNSTTTMVHPGPLLVVTVIMEFTSQFFYLIHPLCPPVIIQLRKHLGDSRILVDMKPMVLIMHKLLW